MRAVQRFSRRVLNFAVRHRGDERLKEEMEAHLAIQTEDNIRAGMTAAEARRHALLKFGAVEAMREEYRAEESLPLVEDLLLDVRYALRVLKKSPAFTAVALVTLALGIGANVVVFGVLNAVLLQPLAVSEPENLYQLRHKPWMSGRLLTTSYPAFEDFRRRNTTFNGMAAINAYSHGGLRWRDAAIGARGDEVSGNYFDLLGVRPAIGRFFHEEDERGPGSAPYIVLSDALWRRAFHADPGVVGAVVQFNRHPLVVVGVAPAQFHGTERFVWPEYWMPLANGMESDRNSRKSPAVTVIGRLKAGVTPEQATENLNAIAGALAREYPDSDDGTPLRLIHPGLYGDNGEVIQGFLYSVTVLALLVLAAASTNLASLFAARTADRSRELALRVALGSSGRRLVRQLLTETALVSLMGGSAGLFGADLLLRALDRWHPPVGHLAVSVDARVYLAGLAMTLGSALLFGMLPAQQARQSSPLQMMKSGPAESAHWRRFAVRDVLLGVQIAVCTLLVTASLVAVRGMARTLEAPLGFEPRGAMLADVDLSVVGDGGHLGLEKQKQMMEAVRSIPGVTAVGTVNRTPMTGGIRGIPIYRPGTTEFTLKNSAMASYVFTMSPGYLEAAGTRLVRGRDVAWHDDANAPKVAIVNQTFARRMWGDAPATGQWFVLRGSLTAVVGVVEDGKYHDLAEAPQAAAYVPLAQSGDSDAIFVVRWRLANGTAAVVERTLSSFVPDAPVSVRSWTDSLRYELFPAQAAMAALGAMGLLAAMLAVTGIFGMAAYGVSRRMKELGIRVALGARQRQVVAAAVGRPMALLGAGSAVGLLSGIAAGRLLGQIVYQANPRDPVVLAGAAATMAALGVMATAIPARRALRVDASKLMREE